MTQNFKKKLTFAALLLTLAISFFGVWLFNLNAKINQSLKTEWFLPPIEIYSQATTLQIGTSINFKQISHQLKQLGFRNRGISKPLFKKDFKLLLGEACEKYVDEKELNCLIFIDPNLGQVLIASNQQNKIIFLNQNNLSVEQLSLPAQLFAQIYGNKPILRDLKKLDEYPYQCLKAVTSIEDRDFLEHEGVSISGMLRAVFGLISTGHITGGGSTITQQLVKNYFLTTEQTFSRKWTEIFMALLLEQKISKEKILENYLNIIYMGQKGSFQVRGFAAASKYYFNKELESLDTAECALLAGLLNNPGRFNPFKHSEQTKKRRDKVLNDMFKNQVIDQQQLQISMNTPLPKASNYPSLPTAPYFVDAIRRKLKDLDIDLSQGVKVYSSLNPNQQIKAKKAIRLGLKHLHDRFKHIEQLKANEGKDLQALLISLDLKNNAIQALIGGSAYSTSQYNRAIDAHRQVGSVMKPMVYLAALESVDENGDNYHPLKIINDEKFNYKYEGQQWSPKNYSNKFWGDIPMYFALKNSINVSTAKIGLQVGLNNIIDVARRAGVTSPLKAFPSLTLGAFELYPFEVLQAYSTIARMGRHIPVHFILKVTNLNDEVLYEFNATEQQRLNSRATATLIGMLKQTLNSGTAKSARAWGFKNIAAGKTGTTSASKDAWFVGFTPQTLTLVWVGYDDNTTHNLTGASGALPIWSLFMKALNQQNLDFQWPEGTKKVFLSQAKQINAFSNLKADQLNDVDLIYRSEDLRLIPDELR